jgi:hypothetical protein
MVNILLFVLVCSKVDELELVSAIVLVIVDSPISLISQYMMFLSSFRSSSIQFCRRRIPLQLAPTFEAFEFLIGLLFNHSSHLMPHIIQHLVLFLLHLFIKLGLHHFGVFGKHAEVVAIFVILDVL